MGPATHCVLRSHKHVFLLQLSFMPTVKLYIMELFIVNVFIVEVHTV